MFKELGAMASLLKQAHTIGPKMQAAMEELKHKQVVGDSGGGMVRVTADGLGQIQKIEIDPAIEERNDWEMARDLLPAAINKAIEKSKELHVEMMQNVTGDLPIPANMEGIMKNLMDQK